MNIDKGIESVFSYLKSQKIYQNKQNFSFQVKSHIDYPSLLSFSDTLNFLDIPNVAFNFPFEEIDRLPDSFVALLGKEHQQSDLFHITKQGNNYLYRQEKKTIKVTKEKLEVLWKNVVLLVEMPEENLEKSKSKIPVGILLAILAMFVLSAVYFFSYSWPLLIFGFLSLIGLYLSVEALKVEFGIDSKISNSFCNIVVNADCGQVINSTKNKWLQKIKISDISLWFFASQILALFVFSVAGFLDKFLSYMIFGLLFSIPMTFYSIYFQYKIEKKWCPICLVIIGIIYVELAFLLFVKPDFYFEAKTLLLFFIIFLIIAGLIYLLKPVFLERKDFSEKYIKQLRFLRNYEIFKNTLQKSDTKIFEKEYIVLGNRESKHKISIVTSPFCGYCKDAHHILDKILSRHSDKVAISIRFNFDENFDEIQKNLFLRLAEIYEQNDDYFMKALNEWFENKNFESWFSKFGALENTESVREKLKDITEENSVFGLNFTPDIFLNQYNFPKQYDRENLEYYITDWIEDEEL